LRTHTDQTFSVLPLTAAAFELVATRIRNGDTHQFIPAVAPEGAPEQQLVFIETTPPWRTNVGIFANGEASAEVIVHDASGAEVQRAVLQTVNGVAQLPVLPQIAGGRAVVRFMAGTGHAYASLVDNRTGDATYVQGR
jgi:hypothetical protein